MEEKSNLKLQQAEFQNKQKFNEAMRRAKACWTNKDYQSAGKFLTEALTLYPKDLDAREMAADILLLNGKVKEAGREYKAIYDEDNTRGYCEEKYAKCVLQAYNSEEKIRQMEAELHGEAPKSDKTNGYMTFLSCLIPGLGRIINEDFLIGAIIFVLYLTFIGIAVNATDVSEGIMSMFFKPTSIVADIIWLGSLIDTLNLFIINKRKK